MTNAVTAERYYRESQEAMCKLITIENEHQDVPACPGWTLHDLLAHVTGALQDFVSNNTEGAPAPEWTATHIERFREAHIEAIKSAWRAALDKAGPVFRRMGDQFVPDVVTHEFDMRGALGNADERGADRLAAAVDVMRSWGSAGYKSAKLPAIEIQTERKSLILGEGLPQASVVTTVFEVSRIFTGRRSSGQIRAMNWSADPTRWLEHMSMLGRRDSDLIE